MNGSRSGLIPKAPVTHRLIAVMLLSIIPMAGQDRADRALLEAEQAREVGVPALSAAVKGDARS